MQINQDKFRDFFFKVVERDRTVLQALTDEVTEWRKKVEENTMAIEIADAIIQKADEVTQKFDEAVVALEMDSNKAVDLWREAERECKEIEDAMQRVRRYGE